MVEETTANATAVVAVEDNGWKKEGSCKVGIDTGKFDNEGKRIIEERDGFKWTKTVDGKDFEIHLPADKTPTSHGVTL